MGTRLNRLAEAVLISTYNLCFEQKYEKHQKFHFLGGNILNIFEQACFHTGHTMFQLNQYNFIHSLIFILVYIAMYLLFSYFVLFVLEGLMEDWHCQMSHPLQKKPTYLLSVTYKFTFLHSGEDVWNVLE